MNSLREWGLDAQAPAGRTHPGRVGFDIDVPTGEPSKWLTLHATRVLEWWDAS